MTPEKKQRIEQIQQSAMRLKVMRKTEDLPESTDTERDYENTINDLLGDIDFLLPLVSQGAVAAIADDLPYRIVEEMGLGLTVRSCTCGQLPCARLQPLRSALEAIAISMHSTCIEKVKAALADARRSWAASRATTEYELGSRAAFTAALSALESVTLQEQEAKQL